MQKVHLHLVIKTLVMLCALFFLPLASLSAQTPLPMNETTGKYFYAKVIFIDSTSKEELYKRAESWFYNHFESQDTGLQIKDKAAGIISGNGSNKIIIRSSGIEDEVPMYFTLTISVKGNRCKFEFTDIVFKDAGSVTAEKKFSGKLSNAEKQYLSRTKKALATIEKSIVATMTNNKEEPVVRKLK